MKKLSPAEIIALEHARQSIDIARKQIELSNQQINNSENFMADLINTHYPIGSEVMFYPNGEGPPRAGVLERIQSTERNVWLGYVTYYNDAGVKDYDLIFLHSFISLNFAKD